MRAQDPAINLLAGIINPALPAMRHLAKHDRWRWAIGDVYTQKVQSMKTNAFVRLAAGAALVVSVAACAFPDETPEQYQARMNTVAALLKISADAAAAATPQPAPHGPFWNTTCSPNGMSYNCITY
jgi:hypothetical protein